MNYGKALSEIRKAKGLSQGDLASKLKVTQTYLCLIEKGSKKPSFGLIEKISEVLSVPVYYFFFKATEQGDIVENKKEVYKLVAPVIEGMIEGIFLK